MLIICKSDSERVYSAEHVFNQRIEAIKKMPEVLTATLESFGYRWDGEYVHSVFGTAKLTDIKIACKLAVCLQLYTGLLFDTYGVSVTDLYKVLLVDTGRLLVRIDSPLRRLTPLNARTESGVLLNNTTDLNVYLFS